MDFPIEREVDAALLVAGHRIGLGGKSHGRGDCTDVWPQERADF